jgi:bacillithiol system protein YtxJ
MESPFNEIVSRQGLDDLILRSNEAPVVILKHSNACPISAAAFQEMARFGGEVALVVVQNAREISQEIEKRTGIEHETPQVIILRDGKAVWHVSHRSIKVAAVEQALAELN